MRKVNRFMHLVAACIFTGLTLLSSYFANSYDDRRWRTFSVLTLLASAAAWYWFFRALKMEMENREGADHPENPASFPEGQAKLIDNGRLPNRFNPRIELQDYEVCHFSVPADRLIFTPLPEGLKLDPSRLAVRFSGGNFYFIVRPQEILLPAQTQSAIAGELAITNQRVLFLAPENAFEVPIQSIKGIDCSAHIVDFQVRDRRYTLLTDAAEYADKVLQIIRRPSVL
jgi:hypothetical protein